MELPTWLFFALGVLVVAATIYVMWPVCEAFCSSR
jgi:hypothetical protein